MKDLRWLLLLLVSIMAMGAGGCGGDDETATDGDFEGQLEYCLPYCEAACELATECAASLGYENAELTALCTATCENPPADFPTKYLGCAEIEECDGFFDCIDEGGQDGFQCTWTNPGDTDGDADTSIDGDLVDGDQVDGDQVDGDQVDGDKVDGDVVDGDKVDGDVVDGDTDGDVDGDMVDGDVIDGDVIDGDVVDGDVVDGDVIDGDVIDGDVIDGDVVDGDVVDGDVVDGDVIDGDMIDGDMIDGDVIDGDMIDGDMIDGDMIDGDMVDGDMVDGDMVDGDMVDGDMVDGDMSYPLPDVGDIIFTEFLANTTGTVPEQLGEWLEIYNMTDEILSLGGLTLCDSADTNCEVLPEDLTIGANETLLFAGSDNPAENGGLTNVAYDFAFSLNNSGDALRLYVDGTTGTLINSVDATEWSQDAGYSWQLDVDYYDPTYNDNAAYWCHGASEYVADGPHYGTPGVMNVSCVVVDGDGVDGDMVDGDMVDGDMVDGDVVDGDVVLGDCCTPHETGGCSDTAINDCVCFYDSWCCDTIWDATCVGEVESFGCGDCGGTDGDVVDGDVIDGDMVDGDMVDGDMVDGDMIDGDMVDGDMIDGDMIDGDMVDGDMVDGDMVDGDMADCYGYGDCDSLCVGAGYDSGMCVDAIQGCACNYDSCDSYVCGTYYDNCSCAAADPCAWQEDGYCDDYCAIVYPDDSFDDSIDCSVDGDMIDGDVVDGDVVDGDMVDCYGYGDCSAGCIDAGYDSGVCSDATQGCVCSYDSCDAYVCGTYYDNCSCAAADPCAWQEDGYCDDYCAIAYPDDYFDDSIDCSVDGDVIDGDVVDGDVVDGDVADCYGYGDCDSLCVGAGYDSGMCVDAIEGCACNYDSCDAYVCGMYYDNCSCAAADPCMWQGDDYCDDYCAIVYPDDHFDDTADCSVDGDVDGDVIDGDMVDGDVVDGDVVCDPDQDANEIMPLGESLVETGAVDVSDPTYDRYYGEGCAMASGAGVGVHYDVYKIVNMTGQAQTLDIDITCGDGDSVMAVYNQTFDPSSPSGCYAYSDDFNGLCSGFDDLAIGDCQQLVLVLTTFAPGDLYDYTLTITTGDAVVDGDVVDGDVVDGDVVDGDVVDGDVVDGDVVDGDVADCYGYGDCNAGCIGAGYDSGVCVDAIEGCACNYDTCDSYVCGTYYDNCSCAAADPCMWQGDDYCDDFCAIVYPDDHFDDTADCSVDGDVDGDVVDGDTDVESSVPVDWSCNDSWYGDDDCDCGCTAEDIDCAGLNACAAPGCNSGDTFDGCDYSWGK